jgi:hypothetical protein
MCRFPITKYGLITCRAQRNPWSCSHLVPSPNRKDSRAAPQSVSDHLDTVSEGSRQPFEGALHKLFEVSHSISRCLRQHFERAELLFGLAPQLFGSSELHFESAEHLVEVSLHRFEEPRRHFTSLNRVLLPAREFRPCTIPRTASTPHTVISTQHHWWPC